MRKIYTLVGALIIGFTGFSQTFVNEDFSSFTMPVQPPMGSGWKNVDSLNTPPSDSIWRFDNPFPRTLTAPLAGNVAIVDSDYYGLNETQDCYLSTPDFDASMATVVRLEFDHVYRHFNGTPISTAEVQVFNGSNWITDTVYLANTDPTGNDIPTHAVIDISQYAAGVSNAQVRFRYTGNYGWYWIIDNVTIFQPTPDDAAVISVDSTIAGCGLDTNETIVATITNAGSTTFSNFPIAYSINGMAPVFETVTNVLNPGDTLQYSFATKADFSMAGTYNIDVFTSLRGDANNVNDTASGVTIHKQTISSFPYTEGFENGNGGWIPEGVNSSWAIGAPAGTVITSAANGVNSYVTNLTGNYNNNDESFVLGPCFDFTSLNAPQFKMNIWWESEFSWDGAVLQMSIDNGLTWTKVGGFGNPNNWYNDNTIDALQNIEPSEEGWSGDGANSSGGWVLAEHDLTGAANQPSVQLRIVHASDGIITTEGFAFDDILIQEAPATDAGIVSILSPVTNCALGAADSVCVQVANFGAAILNNFPIRYEFNGTVYTDTVNTALNPGDTIRFCFDSTVDVSMTGNYNITVYTDVAADGNLLNDTASSTFDNIPIISGYPYTEGFENGNGGWVSGGVNSSWAIGTPAGTVINFAANGVNSYVTNLTGNYNNDEESFVQGPCFDFTSLNSPQIKMNIWWEPEFSWDGAVLQSSIDGGSTWQKVGAFGDPNNWYNDNTIDGLLNLEPSGEGWTGTLGGGNGSGTWVYAEHDLTGLANQPAVILRVAFGSDGIVTEEGFAFDDVLIQDAPAVDVGVIDLTAPTSACGLGMTDTIKIKIRNFGSGTVTTIPVSYEMNGGMTMTETITTSLAPGDTLDYTFMNSSVNVSTPGQYNFVLYTGAAGDGNNLNDTLYADIENTLKTAPYFESFDGFTAGGGFANAGSMLMNGWNRSNESPDYFWGVETAQTTSANTGPSADNTTGFGNYIYTEASNGVSGDTALITSPCVDVSGLAALKLEFFYHMFGTEINTLYIEVGNNNGYVVVDSIVGAQQAATADPFNYYTRNISSFLGAGEVSVRFKSVSIGCCGGDISIDDFALLEPSATDAGMASITAINSGCGLSNDSIRVRINNPGIGILDTIPVAYTVNGGTPVIDTSFTTLNPGDTIPFTFSVPVNLATPGTYDIVAYTSLSNDGDSRNDTVKTSVTNTPVLAIPYTENFELTDGGWISYGANSSWQWGAPAGTVITSAGQGNNAWVTNLTGTHNSNELSYLESPCFDLSGQSRDIEITFLNTFQTELDFDNAWLEVSTDGGTTWAKSIDNGSARNWYNDVVDQWWEDENNNGAGTWDTTSNVLAGTAGFSAVKVRFVLSSDGGVELEGFGVDSVSIDFVTSINNVAAENTINFSIFPNPTTGEFTLLTPKVQDNLRVMIMDSRGKLVYENILTSNAQRRTTIDMASHAKGVYFVRISDQNSTRVEKLIIK